jgi:hypothetical protein
MMEQLNYGGQKLRAHNKGMDTPLAARDIEKRADACLSYAMQHADIMRGWWLGQRWTDAPYHYPDLCDAAGHHRTNHATWLNIFDVQQSSTLLDGINK